jgi:hypothetical protein
MYDNQINNRDVAAQLSPEGTKYVFIATGIERTKSEAKMKSFFFHLRLSGKIK